jgi:hypothetical protein
MEKVFISYRSTNAEQLFRNGCPVLRQGSTCDCLKAEHCSVGDCEFKRVAIFANRQKYDCKVVPPMFMLPPHTILSPMGFYKNLRELKRLISVSDIFVRFEIQEDSYWTTMELEIWKVYSHHNRFFNVWLDQTGATSYNEQLFKEISKDEKRYYQRLLFYTDVDNWHTHAWGRFSDCFINVCPNCGKLTLFSDKALEHLICIQGKIHCTHCNNAQFEFTHVKGAGGLVRYKYSGDYHFSNILFPEIVNTILLNSKFDELKDMHLICMSYESFPDKIAMIKAGSILIDEVKKVLTNGGTLELRTFQDK